MSDTNGKVVDRCWAHLAELPCPECDPSLIERRERAELEGARVKRMVQLEERLLAAGIFPDDFAEMLWSKIRHRIEGDIERLAQEQVRVAIIQKLEGVSLVATIVGLADKLNRENHERGS